jgi:hypothetical protein
VSDVERLLAAYIEEHQAGGEADPRRYLAQVSRVERLELAALIDAYLVRAPAAPVDFAAPADPSAERILDALERSLAGQAGLWPALLPRLRDRAGLKRSELVGRLAGALGLGGREEKVGRYYHQMEQGLLPAAGVSGRVLDALAGLLGETAEALRQAGASLSPGGHQAAPAPSAAPAFTRVAQSDEPGRASSSAVSGRASTEAWDEVDELFRGG